MKRLLAIFALTLLGPLVKSPAAVPPARRPNILILLADDVGFSDIGCYGGEIRTPNLDAMAAEGLRFTRFYNAARCCPSRASLLTGLYPHQTGVGSMTSDQHLPGYRGFLQPDCVTIAQVLKASGYRTAAAGKWHVGDKISPIDRGFDDFYGFVRGYAVNSWEPRMMIRLPEGRPSRSYKAGEYFATDAITDHALDFMAEWRKADPAPGAKPGEERPWFLYVAYQAAHFPVQSRREDMEGYPELYARGWDQIREQRLARQKKIGIVSDTLSLSARGPIVLPAMARRVGSMTPDGNNPAWADLPADRRADLAQRMAVYAGAVTGMDRNIGRIVADLRAHGELDNTLILFLSDNGACAEWEPFGFDMAPVKNPEPGTGINAGTQALSNVLHRGDDLARMGGPDVMVSYGSAWANACNTPWRLYKHFVHEGGISTPLIAHWPAGIPRRGEMDGQAGHLIDLMATCVDVGRASYPADLGGQTIQPMEGVSLTPAFTGGTIRRVNPLFWEHEGNRALLQDHWKIVARGPKGAWELFDTDVDRAEQHDLAAQQPDRVKKMAALWKQWAEHTRAIPWPWDNSALTPKWTVPD